MTVLNLMVLRDKSRGIVPQRVALYRQWGGDLRLVAHKPKIAALPLSDISCLSTHLFLSMAFR